MSSTLADMATIAERRRMARLVHRFGFGPRPGEFEKLIAGGFDVAANRYLTSPASDAFADNQPPPKVSDQGQRPAANSSGIVAYATEKRAQISSLTMWWLDRMVLSEHSLRERMTWF